MLHQMPSNVLISGNDVDKTICLNEFKHTDLSTSDQNFQSYNKISVQLTFLFATYCHLF